MAQAAPSASSASAPRATFSPASPPAVPAPAGAGTPATVEAVPVVPVTIEASAAEPVVGAIAPAVARVVGLFQRHLATVSFPDVTTDTLAAATAKVRAASAEVAALEAQLHEARRELSEAQDRLLGQAQRALAYARLYADGCDGRPDLTDELAAIHLAGAGQNLASTRAAIDDSRPRRRGRPPKPRASASESLLLPSEQAAEDHPLACEHDAHAS